MLSEGSIAPSAHVYSRLSQPTTSRLETLLSSLTHGYALAYASGLASFHGLLIYINPKVVAIGAGYHGCHGTLGLFLKVSGAKQVDIHDEASWDAAGLGKGDMVHLETPLNPTGEASNIQAFADKAHKRGAYLTVDATFGPPGLQDPFAHGADFVMHSGTKYIGGHSDMLCGVLATRRTPEGWRQWTQLWRERLYTGATIGNMESWLGIRSLRTLELRVQKQSRTATALVHWLQQSAQNNGEDGALVSRVISHCQHASLQTADMDWLQKQMPNGFGPVFSLWTHTEEFARRLPSKLHLFHHATSLGGVESLIEWRSMTDDAVDKRVLRVSVGVEDLEDLKGDLRSAFGALSSV